MNHRKTSNNDAFDSSLEETILKLYEVSSTTSADASEGASLNDVIDKIGISKFEDRIPLYDIKSNKIYLIYRDNVYNRIVYDNYRLVTPELIDQLPSNMKVFMSYYDLDILETTYYKVFYKSFIQNKYITDCVRPSYKSKLSHIRPYYQKDELYYLSIDWGKLEQNTDICEEIRDHDISAETLINHQIHIFKQKSVCLVKYYSLFGSYLINEYCRKTNCCIKTPLNKYVVDPILEHEIELMIKLIKKAPAIESYRKNSTQSMYRLIENDNFLSHLKIGDEYIDPSFMSTTRDPFSYQNNYEFFQAEK